jgi:hypothetical protein
MGRAGKSSTTTCQDNDGWRWEPTWPRNSGEAAWTSPKRSPRRAPWSDLGRGQIGCWYDGPHFIDDPMARKTLDGCDEARAVVRAEVGENGTVENDQCRRRRSGAGDGLDGLIEISLDEVGWLGQGNLNRCHQPSPTSVLPWPHQHLEPAHVVGVRSVERVEIDPGSPNDLGEALGHWCRPIDRTGQHVCADPGRWIQAGKASVLVAESVWIETESGGCSHLKRCEWLWQGRQQGQERRTSARLVSLSSSGHDDLADLGPRRDHFKTESTEGSWGHPRVTSGREDEIRLSLLRGKAVYQPQELVIAGDAIGPVLETGGLSSRFERGEPTVPIGSVHSPIVPDAQPSPPSRLHCRPFPVEDLRGRPWRGEEERRDPFSPRASSQRNSSSTGGPSFRTHR